MATKRERVPVMSIYEWNLTLWATSTTRNALGALGRGIYRELLDWCYAQGEIPNDHAAMARHCGATIEEFESCWPSIRNHFFNSKRKKDSLENAVANIQRKQYFSFIAGQRANGSGNRKKSDRLKPTKSATSEAVAFQNESQPEAVAFISANQEEKRREEKTKEEKTRQDKTASEPDRAACVRKWLDEFMGGEWGPPEDMVVLEILQAIDGHPLEEFKRFLLRLKSRHRAPTQNFRWFASITKQHFGGLSHATNA